MGQAGTALLKSCRAGDIGRTKSLLDSGADPNYSERVNTDESGGREESPLSIVCTRGDFAMAKLLLSNGAQLNSMLKYWIPGIARFKEPAPGKEAIVPV